MVLASAQLHPSFPPGMGRSWQEQGKGGTQTALWSECGSSFSDTGWQQSLGSGRAQGGHKVREGSRKGEANILAPPWRELSPFPLLSQHNTGVGAGVGVVARTVQ